MDTLNKPPELTLAQRFAADTPVLFKKVGLVGLFLIALAASLTQSPEIPKWIAALVGGVGLSLNTMSQFVVKDTSVLANPNATIQDYSALLADLPRQFDALHAGITNTVEAIKLGQVPPSTPPVETPIVKAPALVEVSPTEIGYVSAPSAGGVFQNIVQAPTPASPGIYPATNEQNT